MYITLLQFHPSLLTILLSLNLLDLRTVIQSPRYIHIFKKTTKHTFRLIVNTSDIWGKALQYEQEKSQV